MSTKMRQEIFQDGQDFWLNGLDGQIISVRQFGQTSVISKTIKSSLNQLLVPTMARRTFFLDVAMDPAHLLQVLLVSLTVADDEVPSCILFIFSLRGTCFVGSDLLSGKREVTKLMPTQALQHPLEATASLLFVEGGPSNLLALTTHELGNICALDFVTLDVVMLEDT